MNNKKAHHLVNTYNSLQGPGTNLIKARSAIILEIIKGMAPDACTLEDIQDLWPSDQLNVYPGELGAPTRANMSPLVSVLYSCATAGWESIHREQIPNRLKSFQYRFVPSAPMRQPTLTTTRTNRPRKDKPQAEPVVIPEPVKGALDRLLGAMDADPLLTPVTEWGEHLHPESIGLPRREITIDREEREIPEPFAPLPQRVQPVAKTLTVHVLMEKADGSMLVQWGDSVAVLKKVDF